MDPRCIDGLDALDPAARNGVLTIGNFDGVHLGHQAILRRARELADAADAPVVAMTFEPPPDRILRPADAPLRVVPVEEKCRLLLEAGCDRVVLARADTGLLALAPEAFIEEVLAQRFAPRHVVEGPNFLFGRDRAGNVDTLRRAGEARGFGVHLAEPVRLVLDGAEETVSSTLIRRLVAGGRVAAAGQCLGRAFTLFGRIVRGTGRGRGLLHPTANLAGGEQVCPADGVYAGRARVGGAGCLAAISVGVNPTFSPAAPRRSVEAFLLNAEGDFYDEKMALGFLRRLRDQRRFESTEALRDQIAKDVARVRELYE